MKAKISLGAVLLLAVLLSCATFSQTAYKTLFVSYYSYDATLSVLGDLYKEGKVAEEEKVHAIRLGHIYSKAHNEAVGALAKYEEAGGAGSQDAYKVAATAMADALVELIAYCRPIIERSE